MKHKIVIGGKLLEKFFELDEDSRIGMPVWCKGKLSRGSEYRFEGVVESYTVSYGEVTLICEGKEVFKEVGGAVNG